MPPSIHLPARLLSPSSSLSTLANFHLSDSENISGQFAWLRLGSIKASFTPEVEECLSCWKRLTRQNLPSFRAVDNDGVGGGQFAAAQHCMRTLATGGRGGGNGGDGGRGDADMWESRREGDWWLLVSPLQGSYSVLQRAATGTRAPPWHSYSFLLPHQQPARPWSSTCTMCTNNPGNHIVKLVATLETLPDKQCLPLKSKLLVICSSWQYQEIQN